MLHANALGAVWYRVARVYIYRILRFRTDVGQKGRQPELHFHSWETRFETHQRKSSYACKTGHDEGLSCVPGVYIVYMFVYACVYINIYIYIIGRGRSEYIHIYILYMQLYDGSFARRVTGNHVMSPVFRQETNFGSRNDREGFQWRGTQNWKNVYQNRS